jgi:hypothetical protein
MGSFVTKTTLVAFISVVMAAATLAAESKSPPGPETDLAATGADMMQGPGVTDKGRQAMREFMQSGRAPRAMASMMDMARRMGGGDLMLGMTRMMEMMGSMGGGMMGGQGVTAPGAGQPAR